MTLFNCILLVFPLRIYLFVLSAVIISFVYYCYMYNTILIFNINLGHIIHNQNVIVAQFAFIGPDFMLTFNCRSDINKGNFKVSEKCYNFQLIGKLSFYRIISKKAVNILTRSDILPCHDTTWVLSSEGWYRFNWTFVAILQIWKDISSENNRLHKGWEVPGRMMNPSPGHQTVYPSTFVAKLCTPSIHCNNEQCSHVYLLRSKSKLPNH